MFTDVSEELTPSVFRITLMMKTTARQSQKKVVVMVTSTRTSNIIVLINFTMVAVTMRESLNSVRCVSGHADLLMAFGTYCTKHAYKWLIYMRMRKVAAGKCAGRQNLSLGQGHLLNWQPKQTEPEEIHNNSTKRPEIVIGWCCGYQ